MATTPLKPKTIQEVLAEQNKVVTPSASPTESINKAQLAANQAKAAQREANKQSTYNPPEIDGGGFGSGVTQQERDYMSMGTAGTQYGVSSQQDYNAKYGNLYDASGRLKAPTPTISNIKVPTTAKTDLYTPPKVQTGKLVSDFNSTLKTTGGDKDAYYAGINYAGLTDEDKKRADTLFDMRQKAPKKVSVVRYVDNGDGTTTNYLSDGTTSVVKYSKNADGSLTPSEVPANMFDTYKSQIEEGTKKSKDITEQGKKDQIEGVTSKKDIMTTEYDAEIKGYEDEQNKFESKQNELLSGYESNRLNQVQGDIRRALLARGVDISKIPQEQLIALSGEIGAKAFSDIFSAKERATAAIENARQAKIARVNQLRMNKAITESQYKTDIANINSVADQAKLNAEMKGAEVVFGIQQAKKADTTTTEANTAQAIANMAQYIGIAGTQLRDLYSATQGVKSVGEAMNVITREVMNPDSQLYKNMKSNEEKAAAQQEFLNKIKLMQEETDRIRANKSGGSGTKSSDYPAGTVSQAGINITSNPS